MTTAYRINQASKMEIQALQWTTDRAEATCVWQAYRTNTYQLAHEFRRLNAYRTTYRAYLKH